MIAGEVARVVQVPLAGVYRLPWAIGAVCTPRLIPGTINAKRAIHSNAAQRHQARRTRLPIKIIVIGTLPIAIISVVGIARTDVFRISRAVCTWCAAAICRRSS